MLFSPRASRHLSLQSSHLGKAGGRRPPSLDHKVLSIGLGRAAEGRPRLCSTDSCSFVFKPRGFFPFFPVAAYRTNSLHMAFISFFFTKLATESACKYFLVWPDDFFAKSCSCSKTTGFYEICAFKMIPLQLQVHQVWGDQRPRCILCMYYLSVLLASRHRRPPGTKNPRTT